MPVILYVQISIYIWLSVFMYGYIRRIKYYKYNLILMKVWIWDNKYYWKYDLEMGRRLRL